MILVRRLAIREISERPAKQPPRENAMEITEDEKGLTAAAISRRGLMVGAMTSGAVYLAASAAAAESVSKMSSVRRVVTALDDSGKSVVLFDTQESLPVATEQPVVRNFWTLDTLPAVASMREDLGKAPVTAAFGPGPRRILFRTVDFAPAPPPQVMKTLDPEMFMKLAGIEAPKKGRAPISPFTHRTKTIDFGVVISGEIDMVLDESTVHLKPGDVIVQQETNHAWINNGIEPCRISFVQIEATDLS